MLEIMTGEASKGYKTGSVPRFPLHSHSMVCRKIVPTFWELSLYVNRDHKNIYQNIKFRTWTKKRG